MRTTPIALALGICALLAACAVSPTSPASTLIATPTIAPTTSTAATRAADPSSTVRSVPGAATPQPRTTSLPYIADWSAGPAGWGTTPGWTFTDGMLVSDGENREERAGASTPMEIDDAAFAVEAEIRIDDYTDAGMSGGRASFGLMARIQRDGNGYGAGHCYSLGRYVPVCAGSQQGEFRSVLWVSDRATLDYGQFRPGDGWHRYRLEVRTNQFTFLIDGLQVLDGIDNSYGAGGRVGVWSNRAVIAVRNFTVAAL